MHLFILAALYSLHALAGSGAPTFRFAYRDPAVMFSPTVVVQATAASRADLVRVCGKKENPCTCDFLDSTHFLRGSAPAKVDIVWGNLSCTLPDSIPLRDASYVQVLFGRSSQKLPLTTTLRPEQILPEDHDVNRLRSVLRYSCDFNFLEKIDGYTSPNSFSCQNTLQPCGIGNGNFCFLQVKLPFFLYSDNYSSNVWHRASDEIYNVGGTGKLCGSQIKRFDCTANSPVKQFGLYAERTEKFPARVMLTSRPEDREETYGYAARVNEHGVCPAGMVKRARFSATVRPMPDSTIPSLSTTEISAPNSSPGKLSVTRQSGDGYLPELGGSGGKCDGTTCLPPMGPRESVEAFDYPASGTDTVCVIDPVFLP